MKYLPIASYFLDHLSQQVLRTFSRSVSMIPDTKLTFRPTPENMSAKELGYHVYQVVLLMGNSIRTGNYTEDDLGLIVFDPEQVSIAEDILVYGKKVQNFLGELRAELTEEWLTRPIGPNHDYNGMDAVRIMTEEATHHRGQLQIYLRLIGIKPPGIYDYQ